MRSYRTFPLVGPISRHVQDVDLLRKVRNDVVHGNIREEDIDPAHVRKGINGAVRLVEFIKKKLADPSA